MSILFYHYQLFEINDISRNVVQEYSIERTGTLNAKNNEHICVGFVLIDVNLSERYLLLCIILVAYTCPYVQSESVTDNNVDRKKKNLEELEETNEEKREKEIDKLYSASEANGFLTYEKCLQRMKCPINRQEECSEECKAGNTEEEIEEHSELTKAENPKALRNAPKQKYETNVNMKKSSTKTKHSSTNVQQKGKTDL